MTRKQLAERLWVPVVTIVASGFLCGCARDEAISWSQAPGALEEFSGDYQRLAECVYGEIIAADVRSMFKKYNFPKAKSVRIAADGNGVRYWELVLTETEPGKVSASLNSVITNWDPDAVPTRDVMPTVRACASR
jgi:hypothetical protein